MATTKKKKPMKLKRISNARRLAAHYCGDPTKETLIRTFYDTFFETDGKAFADDGQARYILFQKSMAPRHESNLIGASQAYQAFDPFLLRVHGVFHGIPDYAQRDALAAEIEHGLRFTYGLGHRIFIDHEETTRDQGVVPGNVLRFSKHVEAPSAIAGQQWWVEVHVSDRLRNVLNAVDGYKLIRVYLDGRLTRDLV